MWITRRAILAAVVTIPATSLLGAPTGGDAKGKLHGGWDNSPGTSESQLIVHGTICANGRFLWELDVTEDKRRGSWDVFDKHGVRAEPGQRVTGHLFYVHSEMGPRVYVVPMEKSGKPKSRGERLKELLGPK